MKRSSMFRMTPAVVLLSVLSLGLQTTDSFAGPAYQAYKACLRNCIATTAPWTWARAVCGADCTADYVDTKLGGAPRPWGAISGPALTLAVPWGQGEGVTCQNINPNYPYYDFYPTCFVDGAPSFTVEIAIAPGASTPLRVEVLARGDGDADFISLGDAVSVPNPEPRWQFTAENLQDRMYLFVAHYSTSPSEDLDEAVALYASPEPLGDPVPTREETWGSIKSQFR
jgi:hypothetical protein